jgi:hypothetical protein
VNVNSYPPLKTSLSRPKQVRSEHDHAVLVTAYSTLEVHTSYLPASIEAFVFASALSFNTCLSYTLFSRPPTPWLGREGHCVRLITSAFALNIISPFQALGSSHPTPTTVVIITLFPTLIKSRRMCYKMKGGHPWNFSIIPSGYATKGVLQKN